MTTGLMPDFLLSLLKDFTSAASQGFAFQARGVLAKIWMVSHCRILALSMALTSAPDIETWIPTLTGEAVWQGPEIGFGGDVRRRDRYIPPRLCPLGESMDKIVEDLRDLSDAIGVSGFESNIRGLISQKVKGIADEVSVDPLGNLLVTNKGARPKPRVLLVRRPFDS